jgi:1-aminocyclopropane-1-carboxylate deaminase
MTKSPISENQFLDYGNWKDKQVEVWVKREDLLDPFVSGNKFRKLKYNIQEAEDLKHHTILTFGGAYSNHIAATAAAAQKAGLDSIGIIRGEELGLKSEVDLRSNPTLNFAMSRGMKLCFVSREDYKIKTLEGIVSLPERYFIIPEGGTNSLAVKGCQEILEYSDKKFDFLGVPVGTGGTISGLINSATDSQRVLGFPALKDFSFLKEEINRFTQSSSWEFIDGYDFGGYAKYQENLITFINNFKEETELSLDPIYTGKMFFGIDDLIQKNYFAKGSKILLIHTGGLQGIQGFNQKLTKKGQTKIAL